MLIIEIIYIISAKIDKLSIKKVLEPELKDFLKQILFDLIRVLFY